ncbi:MAG: glycosyltransferase [Bacteroidales bacterium]
MIIYVISILILVLLTIMWITTILNLILPEVLDQSSNRDRKVEVSVLIPARNEAKRIGNLLESLYNIETSIGEIIICDDHSEDDTYDIVNEYAKRDPRIILITSDGLPQHWRGKSWACHQLSKVASKDYLLFLDADVTINGDIIERSLDFIDKYNLGLLSIFPHQNIKNSGVRAVVPIMNTILLSLLILRAVRIIPYFNSISAANGQFMLFKSNIYKKFNPHFQSREAISEDIFISRYLKKNNIKIACISHDWGVVCSMYENYKESCRGFSKNIVTLFLNSRILASIIIFIWAASAPTLYILDQTSYALFATFYISTIWLSIGIISGWNPIINLLYYPLHIYNSMYILMLSIYNDITNNQQWKGRKL